MRKYFTAFICVALCPVLLCAGETCCKLTQPAPMPPVSTYKPPILATSAIIEVYQDGVFLGIVLIERGKTPIGKALPGGKVEYGESVEEAVRREMMEEVSLELDDLKQFHVYSDPDRDPRRHTVDVIHVAKSYKLPVAGDDAAAAAVVPLDSIPFNEIVFDHARIIKDYLKYREGDHTQIMLKP